MARRLLGEVEAERRSLDDVIQGVRDRADSKAFARSVRPRPALTRVVVGGLQDSMSEAAAMMNSGNWSNALARHAVALWAMCHERVYRVSAVGELDGMGWKAALKAASDMLRAEFDGDASELAGFVRWCWLREQGKERWCQQKGYERRYRLTWRRQFSAEVLADWRLEMARKGMR